MTLNDKEILEMIHINIHGLRMLPNYSPSIFEQKLNKIICERFEKGCVECKEKLSKLKNAPETQKKEGFMERVFKE